MKHSRFNSFRSVLALKGETIRSWSISHSFNPKTVYSILNGRLSGERGKVSLRIAKAINLVLAESEKRKAAA